MSSFVSEVFDFNLRDSHMHKFIFVMGPTASGKSDLALRLAEQTGGVILNCDSIQCYEGLQIGSALPRIEDFKRAPHELYAYVPKGQEMTAGQFRRDFYAKIESYTKPQVFLVVGGTGFYFQAIEFGMYEAPVNLELKELLEIESESAEGLARLYQELERVDPESASKISGQDAYRITRALTVIRTSGQKLSQIKENFEKQKAPFPYALKKIGVAAASRENLQLRVQTRTNWMLGAGLVQEVENLLVEGLENWAPMRSVGYKETIDFLKNHDKFRASLLGIEPQAKISLENLALQITQNTMRLAKKQKTEDKEKSISLK